MPSKAEEAFKELEGLVKREEQKTRKKGKEKKGPPVAQQIHLPDLGFCCMGLTQQGVLSPGGSSITLYVANRSNLRSLPPGVPTRLKIRAVRYGPNGPEHDEPAHINEREIEGEVDYDLPPVPDQGEIIRDAVAVRYEIDARDDLESGPWWNIVGGDSLNLVRFTGSSGTEYDYAGEMFYLITIDPDNEVIEGSEGEDNNAHLFRWMHLDDLSEPGVEYPPGFRYHGVWNLQW